MSACALLLVAATAQAMDVWVSGSWSLTLGASDLSAGAGTDLVDPQTNTSGEVELDVTLTLGPLDDWRIDVRRSDVDWDSDVHLWVRRTGDGSGLGSVSSGSGWQEIGSTDTAFFTGLGDRLGVTLQLKVTGLGVGVPADTYATSVVYTLVNT